MLDLVPSGIERGTIIEQPDPERRQRADPAPRPAIGAAHFEEALEPHLREDGREVIGEIGHQRLLAGERRQAAVEKVAEGLAGDVEIFAVAVDEVHRHIERVIEIAFVAEPVLEHERQHAGAVRIGVRPDMAAEGEETVGLSFGEWRIGEERGGQWLEREPDAELARHVGFRGIIEVDLDGAGAKHHVEAERADLRHIVEHDAIAALGHSGQLFAGLVRPHAEAEEADTELVADRLHLHEVPAGFGTGLVDVAARRAGQLELAGGLEADRAVGAGERDDLVAFHHRAPPEAGECVQQVPDAARLVIGGRAVIGMTIDELLMLGADPPVGGRLFAFGKDGEEIVAAFDAAVGLGLANMRGHRGAL